MRSVLAATILTTCAGLLAIIAPDTATADSWPPTARAIVPEALVGDLPSPYRTCAAFIVSMDHRGIVTSASTSTCQAACEGPQPCDYNSDWYGCSSRCHVHSGICYCECFVTLWDGQEWDCETGYWEYDCEGGHCSLAECYPSPT